MRRDYARMTDSGPEWAPEMILEGGYRVANPAGERLAAMGFKPVVYDEQPVPLDPRAAFRPRYTETPECIRVGWEVEPTGSAPAGIACCDAGAMQAKT